MKRRSFFTVYLFLISILAGCAEPQILEDIGLITTVGYDLGEKGEIKGTAVELKIEPNAKTDIKIVEAQALSIRGVKTNGNKKTSKRLLSGQLRVIVFGEELAKQGIVHVSETLTKDPSISDITYLVISEGDARELLKLKNEHIPDIGLHVYRLIEQNTKGELMPSATLQEVLHRYYSVGRDVFIPILKREDNSETAFSGVGIFKMGQLVGRISTNESFYLKLINDKYSSGSTEISFKSESPKLKAHHGDDKIIIALDTINSDSDLKLINKKNLEFEIKIKLNARLLDLNSDINLTNPANLKLFEKEVAKEIKQQTEKLISYCQSKNSDVIGLGEVYRYSVRNSHLTKEKWHTMFQNAKVNVKVDFKMIRSGINE
jgi:spore germination protein